MKLWLARDSKDDTIWAYDQEPIKRGNYYSSNHDTGLMFQIPKSLFLEITFENSPQQIEIKLIK